MKRKFDSISIHGKVYNKFTNWEIKFILIRKIIRWKTSQIFKNLLETVAFPPRIVEGVPTLVVLEQKLLQSKAEVLTGLSPNLVALDIT